MSGNDVSFSRLANKGFPVLVSVMDESSWQQLTSNDPSIPRTFSDLRQYGSSLCVPSRAEKPGIADGVRGVSTGEPSTGECGEDSWYRFFQALSNPALSTVERNIIEADLDSAIPTFEKVQESDHFILQWTNANADTSHNISDDSVIAEVRQSLEKAWSCYTEAFGQTPYIPKGMTKIPVCFFNISEETWGVASPPDGPICLNSRVLVNNLGLKPDPFKPNERLIGVRQTVPAHELFHKMQYAFGFRREWTPYGKFQWFSEGLASWAEVFTCQCVSRRVKFTDMYDNPEHDLFTISYNSVPFWVFFETCKKSETTDNIMLAYLERCRAKKGNVIDALKEVIAERPAHSYNNLGAFYQWFSSGRCFYQGWNAIHHENPYYKQIRSADSRYPIQPTVRVTEVTFGDAMSYEISSTVKPLGCNYYRFVFEEKVKGQSFILHVDGVDPGDYSFEVIKNNDNGGYTAYAPQLDVNLRVFDYVENCENVKSVELIIAGQGVGGKYSLTANIT